MLKKRIKAMEKKRNGMWFQTYTGKAWWPEDPQPEDVDILDIAHSLSMQCRFNGHCKKFYSVAQHSVNVGVEMYYKFGPEAGIVGLLHDAAEAYLGDIVKPVKSIYTIEQDFYYLERDNLKAIYDGLGLDFEIADEWREETKKFDLKMLATERRDLMGKPPREWCGLEQADPFGWNIIVEEPKDVRNMFTDTLSRLSRLAGI